MKFKDNPTKLIYTENNPVLQFLLEVRFKGIIPGRSLELYNKILGRVKEISNSVSTESNIFNNDLLGGQGGQQDQQFIIRFESELGIYRIIINSSAVSLAVEKTYKGWDKYFDVVKNILFKVELPIINRLGLRPSTKFEVSDVFNHCDVSIIINNEELAHDPSTKTFLIRQFKLNNFDVILQLIDEANVFHLSTGSWEKRGMIDIDLQQGVEEKGNNDYPQIERIITEAHESAKLILQSIVKDEWIKEQNAK